MTRLGLALFFLVAAALASVGLRPAQVEKGVDVAATDARSAVTSAAPTAVSTAVSAAASSAPAAASADPTAPAATRTPPADPAEADPSLAELMVDSHVATVRAVPRSLTASASDTTPTVSVPAPPPPRSRPYRRRWRNRYPGPIPTPEEWTAPEGPVRIALQAGHWRADEAPDELRGLRDNGTRWGRLAEWEVNLAIVERTAELLKDLGYEVDVLPAVVPPGYRAHLFVSIHADGSGDTRASGYRVGWPGFDATGRAAAAASLLDEQYGAATGLRRLPDVTRRMRNYYAFNFRRYEHALHPMTIALILETGFLTSPRDRTVIVDDPERAARGIVAAVTRFPITPPPTAAVAPATGSKPAR